MSGTTANTEHSIIKKRQSPFSHEAHTPVRGGQYQTIIKLKGNISENECIMGEKEQNDYQTQGSQLKTTLF